MKPNPLMKHLIKKGAVASFEGSSNNPTLMFEFSNPNSALKVLTGRKEITELGSEIKLSGDAAKAVQLNFIMDTVKDYIGGLAR